MALVSLTATVLPSFAAGQQGANAAPPITLPNTHAHVLKSRINGETYSVAVVLPADYNISRATNKRYPALYLLDGGLELAIVHPIVGAGGFGPAAGVSADVILVGVGRAEGQAQKRDRDYTLPQPGDSSYENARSADGSPRFGGAASFLRVLKEEVIPLIDRTYRTNGDRGIHGQSLGGYFVAYAMFERPISSIATR